jgi:hypothetical protein
MKAAMRAEHLPVTISDPEPDVFAEIGAAVPELKVLFEKRCARNFRSYRVTSSGPLL